MTRKKSTPLILLALLSFLAGALEYGPAHGPQFAGAISTGYAVAALLLVFIWFRRDARERVYHRSVLLNLAMLGLTVFALPYYLFTSRGARGGWPALGRSLLLFAAIMAMYGAGARL